jgi:chromosome segregation ATPase
VDPATGEVLESDAPSPAGGAPSGDGTAGTGEIELDFDPAAERARRRPGPHEDAAATSPAAGHGPPSGGEVPPEEHIDRIAGFGDPPDSFFKTAGYMLHVRRRRGVLAAEIARIEEELREARSDLDADLLDIGKHKEKEAAGSGRFGRELDAIHAMQSRITAHRKEQDIEEQDRRGQEVYLDEEISRLEVEAEKYRNEEDIVAREAEDAYDSRKRVQLKLQRVEIEIRNIRQTMPRSAKDEPPIAPEVLEPYERQIAEREEAAREMKAELAEAEDRVKQINRKLAMARNAVSEQMGKIALANKKKAQILEQARSSEQGAQRALAQMQQDLEERYRDLAMSALEQEELPGSRREMAPVVTEKIAKVESIEEKLDLHRRALDSYSRSDFTKGHVLLGGAAALALLVVVLVLVIAL